MKRDELQRVLGFMLLVMVCGGGCMTVPYSPGVKDDLRWAGVDDHARARLAGHADPRSDDPKPVAQMSGKLLVYHLASSLNQEIHYYGGRVYSPPKEKDINRLTSLDGITDTQVFLIKWPDPNEKPLAPIDPRQLLLEQARDAGGDLILLYTCDHDAKAADITLSLAQFLMLGFAPTVFVSADASLEAVLIDAHSGYIYALGEGEGSGFEITNEWGRQNGKRDGAAEAIENAFSQFTDHLQAAWPTIQEAYQE